MDMAPEWGACKPRGLAAIALQALKHRLVRGPLKRPLYRFIQSRSRAHDVEFEGIKLRCHISDNGPERFVILQEKRRDWASLKRCTEHLRSGDCFLDIGANFGLFTTYAAKIVGSTGRVVAVEPLPEMVERLRFNVWVNRFEHVTIVAAAAGERAGEAELFVSTASFARSSLHNDVQHSALAVKVPVLPLMEIVAQAGLSRIDGMKLDIEGYEDKALLPFFEQAPEALWPKRVLIEVLHRAVWTRDCVNELRARGYDTLWESKGDVLLAKKNSP